jgi:hypothetical protein
MAKLVAIDNDDVIRTAFLRFYVSNLSLCANISTSKGSSRWKSKGGPSDPLRDEQPELKIYETIWGKAEIQGSMILSVGQSTSLTQKFEIQIQSAAEFDGSSWEHSNGWIKFVPEAEDQYWFAWFSTPNEVFKLLVNAIRRKAVGQIGLMVTMRTHGSEHFNDPNKIEQKGIEAFVTSISWQETAT